MSYYRTALDEKVARFSIFVAYAEEMADLLEGKRDSTAPAFRSPSVLLSAIRDEMAAGAFRNRNLIAFLHDEIVAFLKDDQSLRSDQELTVYFDLLRESFAESMKSKTPVMTGRFEELVSMASSLIKGGRYAKAALSTTERHVTDVGVALNHDAFRATIRNLAFAFITMDYSPAGFRKAVRAIADGYQESPDGSGVIATAFPFATSKLPYLTGGRFERRAFNEALRSELDELTVERRLDALATYIYAEPKQYTVIFRVQHLRGLADLRLGDVQFYHALAGTPRFARCDWLGNASQLEAFGEPDGVNAAVTISARDIDSAIALARERVNSGLDQLRSGRYGQMPLSIDVRYTLVIDATGHFISSRGEIDPNKSTAWAIVHSLDLEYLNEWHMRRYAAILAHCGGTVDWKGPTIAGPAQEVHSRAVPEDPERMRTVLHQHRRAVEAEESEDRLLSSWIGLETLLGGVIDRGVIAAGDSNVEARARSLLPALAVGYYRLRVAFDVHTHLANTLRNQEFSQVTGLDMIPDPRAKVILPLQIMMRASLNQPREPTLVRAKDIVATLPEVLIFTIDPLLRAEIQHALSFYSKAAFALAELRSVEESVRGEITMIYQLRNRIVHQGAGRQTLAYYADRALHYLNTALGAIFEEPDDEFPTMAGSERKVTRESLLRVPVATYVAVERLKARLRQGDSEALLAAAL